jgi:hypothetical protein
MRAVAAVRALYGAALLAVPERILALYGGHPSHAAERAVARILGARHVAQAFVTRNGAFRRLGAAVDVIHAASMFGLAAISEPHRQPALIDGTIAAALSITGNAG